jgi:hypothetical protein
MFLQRLIRIAVVLCCAGIVLWGLTAPAEADSSDSTVQGLHIESNSALRALSPGVVTRIWRDAFTTLGDAPPVLYTWNPSNCSAADNGAQVQPTTGTGCWKATLSGENIVPEIWGAPHNNGSTDDGPFFNAMFAAAAANNWNNFSLVCNGTPYIIQSNVTASTPVTFRGCGSMSNIIQLHNAVTFAFTGAGSVISDLGIQGDLTSGQVGISVSGSEATARNVRVTLADTCFLEPVGSGPMIKWDHPSGRNCASYFMDIQDGVGPNIDEPLYDTDGTWYACSPCYNVPTAGGIVIETEGAIVNRPEMIHGGAGGGIEFIANGSHHANGPIYEKVIDGWSDSNFAGPSVHLVNNTGGATPMHNLFFNGVAFTTSAVGLKIETDGSSAIDTVVLNGGQVGNNIYDGIITSGNLGRFYINGTVVGGNDAVYVPYPGFLKVSGTYSNISLNHRNTNAFGASRIVGAEIGRYDTFTSSPNYNLKIANGILIDMLGTFFDSGGARTANTLIPGVSTSSVTWGQMHGNTNFPQNQYPPTLSSCGGTGTSIVGSDLSGQFRTGTSSTSSCKLTWYFTWSAPIGGTSPLVCSLQPVGNSPVSASIRNQNTTSITWIFKTSVTSATFQYQCEPIGA